MSENVFKVGDSVICVDDTETLGCLILGNRYTVEKVTAWGDIYLEELEGGWMQKRFKLVSSEKTSQFDWKTTPWYIQINSDSEYNDAIDFLSTVGVDVKFLQEYYHIFISQVYVQLVLTNTTKEGFVYSYAMHGEKDQYSINEIKISKKITYDVEYPEVISTIENKKISELQEQVKKLNEQIAALKKPKEIDVYLRSLDEHHRHKVVLKEYERGWGSDEIDFLYFVDEQSAMEYVNKENSKNTSKTVPDYYIIASYEGEVK